jgi:hypothetical protein
LLHTVSECFRAARAFGETNRETNFGAKILFPQRDKNLFYYRALDGPKKVNRKFELFNFGAKNMITTTQIEKAKPE